METVQFVSAAPYLNVSDEIFNNLFIAYKGRKEVVIKCSLEIRAKLEAIEQETFFPQIGKMKKYLDVNNIPWTEDLKGTTTI